MSTMILALDLGKFNSVLCWYEPEASTPALRSVKSTPELLRGHFPGTHPGPHVVGGVMKFARP